MAKNALHTIRREAEKLRERHPGMKYQTALKKAGKEYRQGKVSGGIKHKGRKKAKRHAVGTKPKYKVIHEVRRISGIQYRGGSVRIAGTAEVERTKEQLRLALGEQLGWLDVQISQAKTKREKTALQKIRREKLTELNKLK